MNANTDSRENEENVPDASELLDFELIAKSQPEKSSGLWLWVVLVLVLAGGGWAGWMYMEDQQEKEVASTGTAPMILAPKFPLKQKPVSPGGMDVPDRDKLVYERMAGDQAAGGAGQVERLLPPPETPIQPPQTKPVEMPQTPAPSIAEATPDRAPAPPQTPGAKPEVKPVEVAQPAPKPEPKPVPKPEPVQTAAPQPSAPEPAPKPATKPAPKPTPEPTATAKATGTAGQGYMVQLSAVRNEANARGEWARLAKKHPDVLGGLELVVQRADLGAKGVFYRVRAGWFANRAEAKAICDELKKRNVGCLIARP